MADPVKDNPLGTFEGSSLSRESADELAIATIPAKLLGKEAQLFRSKWYDYRRLHPMVATYYFVHCYGEAYRDAMVKSFDCERGIYRKGVKGNFILKKERLSFWRLRQMADGMGIPYRPFLTAAISHYIDHTGWKNVPRPGHLAAGTAPSAAYEAWESLCKHRLQLPVDPFFTAEGFVGHPYQVECELWLLEQAQRRERPKFALAALVDTYKRVRESVLQRLPPQLQDEVARERALAMQLSQS